MRILQKESVLLVLVVVFKPHGNTCATGIGAHIIMTYIDIYIQNISIIIFFPGHPNNRYYQTFPKMQGKVSSSGSESHYASEFQKSDPFHHPWLLAFSYSSHRTIFEGPTNLPQYHTEVCQINWPTI